MDWELDHVFLACSDVAAAKRVISDFGITLSEGRTHPGQGTANVCAHFENAFFELLFSVDEEELESEIVRPLGLKERIEWKTTGACPFGVCLRPVAASVEPDQLPVECWGYTPDYVPAGASIPIATPPGSIREPLVFIATHRNPNPGSITTMHRGEPRTLSRVEIRYPETCQLSASVRWFADNSPLSLIPGGQYEMALVWGEGDSGSSEIATLPLCVRW